MTVLSRSSFLTLTSSFAGSLVLGVGLDVCAKPADALAAGEGFAPNVWLRVHPDQTVTVYLNKTEMGQGVSTGLPTIMADELDVPLARVRVEFAQAEAVYVYPGTAGMITGGSTSMRDSWFPLRRAAASARAMLVQAAAKEWGVDPAGLRTREGAVIDPRRNRAATYGSLAAAAAALPVPAHVTLKTPAEYRLIGRASTQRTDIPEKVDGKARFGIDVTVPGMRYAAIARSPVFGGRVRSFDATKAKAVHGVIDVVQVPTGVAVIAHHTWAAFGGRDALAVQWDEGPNAQLDTAQLFAAHERVARDRSQWRVALKRGDADTAHGRVVEALYRGPFLAHATMEPMNATAHVHDGICEVWAPMQNLTRAQAAAAKITGFPLERCHMYPTLLGGGFGRRLQSDFVEEAVAVSKAIGAPVKVMWTREDDIQHDFYRPMSVNALRGVIGADGRLVGLTHTVVSESIRHLYEPARLKKEHGRDDAALNGVADLVYDVPNFTAAYAEYEHGVPIGSWRAPDASFNTFATEGFINELAHAAGKDPVAFRLAMLPPDSVAARCLREAARRGGWGHPRGAGIHQGVAVMIWNGSIGALVADVAMNGKMPQVKHVTAVVHCGTVVNPKIVTAQTTGAIMYGLSAALTGKITIANGRVQQSNFDSYTVLHMQDAPRVDAYALPSEEPPTGIGELGLPGIAPAVAGAVFAATGKRVRTLPFSDALT
ncbi:MAG TPA: molybdopterin cofactor-binding domain-containing protein [Candidatus Acidoferrum sp.]|nr:molybdopterin cofactor-binding domain-containing protein [Candidatus Acidoferrum sp.]